MNQGVHGQAERCVTHESHLINDKCSSTSWRYKSDSE